MFKAHVHLVLALLLVTGAAQAQQTKVWNVVDTSKAQYYGTGQGKVLSAYSSSDIVLIADATDSNKFRHAVKRSTDGGQSWSTLYDYHIGGAGSIRWRSIIHPSHELIVIVGDSDFYLGHDQNYNTWNRYVGLITLSRDAGQTWSTVFLDSNTIVRDMAMQNANEGFMLVSHPGNIYNPAPADICDSALITTDAWRTWRTTALPKSVQYANGLCTVAPHTYGILGWTSPDTNYTFYRTQDDGITWERLGAASDWGKDMLFLSSTHGLVAGGGYPRNSRLWETRDGGNNWSLILDTAFPDYYGVFTSLAASDSTHVIVAGAWMVSTNDGGHNWQFDFPPLRFKYMIGPLLSLVMPDSNFALAAAPQDFIAAYTGQSTLAAPFLYPHEFGPIAIAPTSVSWTPVQGATSYRLQLAAMDRSKGTVDSTVYRHPLLDTVVTDTTVIYNSPLPNLYYYARVEALNQTQHSDWREKVGIFYTVVTSTTPLPPKIVSPRSASTVKDSLVLRWRAIAGAESYTVRLYEEDLFLSNEATVTDTTVTFTGLHDQSMYAVVVRANVPNDTTDWSGGDYYINFRATAGVPGAPDDVFLAAYPNPVRSELHVRVSPEDANAPIYLIDLLGNRVASVSSVAGAERTLDVRGLPAGTYMLVVQGRGHSVRRISVEH